MGRKRLAALVMAVGLVLVWGPSSQASHFYSSGWRDRHVLYPPVPSGLTAINNVFGQPCNSQVNKNTTQWVAANNGVTYPVHYHYKLGGYGPYYGGTGSTSRSSNLNNDVRGHIRNNHLGEYVTHGIYGYNCRRISGSSKWSTHAWGIAVDINSAANPYPTYQCKGMPSGLISIWTGHGWTHGQSFGDCMHFQYAKNY